MEDAKKRLNFLIRSSNMTNEIFIILGKGFIESDSKIKSKEIGKKQNIFEEINKKQTKDYETEAEKIVCF